MSDETKLPRMLTTKELSEQTRIPAWRIFQLVKQRPDKRARKPKPLPPPAPHFWIGRTIYFPEDAVQQWFKGHTQFIL